MYLICKRGNLNVLELNNIYEIVFHVHSSLNLQNFAVEAINCTFVLCHKISVNKTNTFCVRWECEYDFQAIPMSVFSFIFVTFVQHQRVDFELKPLILPTAFLC